jgi:hypothetical protein
MRARILLALYVLAVIGGCAGQQSASSVPVHLCALCSCNAPAQSAECQLTTVALLDPRTQLVRNTDWPDRVAQVPMRSAPA